MTKINILGATLFLSVLMVYLFFGSEKNYEKVKNTPKVSNKIEASNFGEITALRSEIKELKALLILSNKNNVILTNENKSFLEKNKNLSKTLDETNKKIEILSKKKGLNLEKNKSLSPYALEQEQSFMAGIPKKLLEEYKQVAKNTKRENLPSFSFTINIGSLTDAQRFAIAGLYQEYQKTFDALINQEGDSLKKEKIVEKIEKNQKFYEKEIFSLLNSEQKKDFVKILQYQIEETLKNY